MGDAEARLSAVRAAPADTGTLELIVRRPAPRQRELLESGELDLHDGLVGDRWIAERTSRKGRGRPPADTQVTIMNARAAAVVAGGDDRERWALAGDQLYVDLDLSHENVPPGTRLEVGAAVLEVTEAPHLGCGKFSRYFGVDALKLVNSPEGRELRLRGLNARVVSPGAVRRGDRVTKVRG